MLFELRINIFYDSYVYIFLISLFRLEKYRVSISASFHLDPVFTFSSGYTYILFLSEYNSGYHIKLA